MNKKQQIITKELQKRKPPWTPQAPFPPQEPGLISEIPGISPLLAHGTVPIAEAVAETTQIPEEIRSPLAGAIATFPELLAAGKITAGLAKSVVNKTASAVAKKYKNPVRTKEYKQVFSKGKEPGGAIPRITGYKKLGIVGAGESGIGEMQEIKNLIKTNNPEITTLSQKALSPLADRDGFITVYRGAKSAASDAGWSIDPRKARAFAELNNSPVFVGKVPIKKVVYSDFAVPKRTADYTMREGEIIVENIGDVRVLEEVPLEFFPTKSSY